MYKQMYLFVYCKLYIYSLHSFSHMIILWTVSLDFMTFNVFCCFFGNPHCYTTCNVPYPIVSFFIIWHFQRPLPLMIHILHYVITSTIAAYPMLFHLPHLNCPTCKTTCFSLLNDIAYRGIIITDN